MSKPVKSETTGRLLGFIAGVASLLLVLIGAAFLLGAM